MLLGLLVLLAAGCRKGDGQTRVAEAPITGSKSDPAVDVSARWSTTNRFLYHFDLYSAAQYPGGRRDGGGDSESTVLADVSFSAGATNADGSRTLEMEITSMDLELLVGDRVITTGGESIGDDRARSTAGAVRRMNGGKVLFKVGPDNLVQRVIGVDSLFSRVTADPAGPTTNAALAKARRMNAPDTTMLRRIINESALRQVAESFLVPNKPVTIGDEWTVRRDIAAGMSGAAPMSIQYSFRGMQKVDERNCARIELKGEYAPPKADGDEAQQQRRRRFMDNLRNGGTPNPTIEAGEYAGKVWYDPALGVVTAADSEVRMTLKMPTWGGRIRGSTNAPTANVTVPYHQQLRMFLIAVQPK